MWGYFRIQELMVFFRSMVFSMDIIFALAQDRVQFHVKSRVGRMVSDGETAVYVMKSLMALDLVIDIHNLYCILCHGNWGGWI